MMMHNPFFNRRHNKMTLIDKTKIISTSVVTTVRYKDGRTVISSRVSEKGFKSVEEAYEHVSEIAKDKRGRITYIAISREYDNPELFMLDSDVSVEVKENNNG